MPFNLLPATEVDYAHFIPPLFATMGSAGFISALYPRNNTPAGQNKAIERYKIEQANNPGIRWIKAVGPKATEEDGSPKIVAIAQWAILEDAAVRYADCLEVAPQHMWADDAEKEYAAERWEGYIRPRREVLQKERLPIMCLQILCTWPQYQRRGAGRQLVEWGYNIADELNALCTVEASSAGIKLCTQCGFEFGEDVTHRVSERSKDMQQTRGGIRFMVRKRRRLE